MGERLAGGNIASLTMLVGGLEHFSSVLIRALVLSGVKIRARSIVRVIETKFLDTTNCQSDVKSVSFLRWVMALVVEDFADLLQI
jgi:hypothetical protein